MKTPSFLTAILLLAVPAVGTAAAPVLKDGQEFYVHVQSTHGTPVGTIELENPAEVSPPLTFTILSGDPDTIFAISAEPNEGRSGLLSVADAASLAEQTNGTRLLLEVEVLEGEAEGDTAVVTLIIYRPATFVQTEYTVAENSPGDTLVGQLAVSDSIGAIRFAVDTNATTHAAALLAFTVTAEGSILVLGTKPLDYEAQAAFTLAILATDDGQTDTNINRTLQAIIR